MVGTLSSLYFADPLVHERTCPSARSKVQKGSDRIQPCPRDLDELNRIVVETTSCAVDRWMGRRRLTTRVWRWKNVQGAVTFAVPESDTGLQVTFAPAGLGAQLRWDASGQ